MALVPEAEAMVHVSTRRSPHEIAGTGQLVLPVPRQIAEVIVRNLPYSDDNADRATAHRRAWALLPSRQSQRTADWERRPRQADE
jgi:hypothetical protein